MNKVKDAIRYGIETLGVTPEMMFNLIESSNGYAGEDYSRWLANEIINIADDSGVGYSQLLVKKFNIIQSLIEDYSDNSLQEYWKKYIEDKLNGYSIYSDGIEDIGDQLDNVDWFNGIDYDEMNSEFFYEKIPQEVKEQFLSGEKIAFFVKMSSEALSKKSSMFLDAKKKGILLRTEGAGMLYRMCQIINAFDSIADNLKFAFIASTDFLTSSENAEAIEYFLRYFNYEGMVVNAGNLLSSSFASVDYSLVFCTPRRYDSPRQDGFVLKTAKFAENGELVYTSKKRYSRSEKFLLDYIKKLARGTKLDTVTEVELPTVSEKGIYTGKSTKVLDGLGYLCMRGYNMLLSTLPVEGYGCIPINRKNLNSVVIYYGVATSLRRFGLSSDIKEILTGHKNYPELLYNCFPLFLFDCGSIFCDVDVDGNIYKNKYAYDLDWVSEILEKGELYFSPEAKEIIYTCKGFMDYLKSQSEDVTGKSFEQIRHEMNNEDLNKAYLDGLTNLYDYVSSCYRRMC